MEDLTIYYGVSYGSLDTAPKISNQPSVRSCLSMTPQVIRKLIDTWGIRAPDPGQSVVNTTVTDHPCHRAGASEGGGRGLFDNCWTSRRNPVSLWHCWHWAWSCRRCCSRRRGPAWRGCCGRSRADPGCRDATSAPPSICSPTSGRLSLLAGTISPRQRLVPAFANVNRNGTVCSHENFDF